VIIAGTALLLTPLHVIAAGIALPFTPLEVVTAGTGYFWLGE
jgi:hypothetical protein